MNRIRLKRLIHLNRNRYRYSPANIYMYIFIDFHYEAPHSSVRKKGREREKKRKEKKEEEDRSWSWSEGQGSSRRHVSSRSPVSRRVCRSLINCSLSVCPIVGDTGSRNERPPTSETGTQESRLPVNCSLPSIIVNRVGEKKSGTLLTRWIASSSRRESKKNRSIGSPPRAKLDESEKIVALSGKRIVCVRVCACVPLSRVSNLKTRRVRSWSPLFLPTWWKWENCCRWLFERGENRFGSDWRLI